MKRQWWILGGLLLILSGVWRVPDDNLRALADGPGSAKRAVPQTVVFEAGNDSPIIVGLEYALIDIPWRTAELAEAFASVGATAVKPLAEHIEWGAMQSSPDTAIDFTQLDNFVMEFQAAGFRDIVLALKSHSPWASKDYNLLAINNPTPKPEYVDDYEAWIRTIVERYDGDGLADMPNLIYPIRYYEIGSEFSSYEPESADEYLAMLAVAYNAAHQASDTVLVTHAAFLTTFAFDNNPAPGEYEAAFADMPARMADHTLADIRQILDRPDLFDLLNVHALGDPLEIEAIVTWLNYEMGLRGYNKRIIISDTTPAPFIAWGPATTCNQPAHRMGLIVRPAIEADRCRLASYFQQLLDNNEETLRWTQGFVASDMVKKVTIAAEQNVLLISTAFMEDLEWFKLKFWQAGAGNSAWAGMIALNQENRAGFYALQQLMQHLKGYTSLTRLALNDPNIRLYNIKRDDHEQWLAWYEPDRLILPNEPIPTIQLYFQTQQHTAIIEPSITQFEVTTPQTETIVATNGVITITLSPTPIFIEVNGQPTSGLTHHYLPTAGR